MNKSKEKTMGTHSNGCERCKKFLSELQNQEKEILASHYIDIRLRINGKYKWIEGDFVKEFIMKDNI